MKKLFLSVILTLLVMTQLANAQSFAGLGLGAAMPQTQYPEQSTLGLHGELQYGVNRFCNM
ncbi:MAG: hypothetical protein ACKO0Y_10565, partial [Bacteroidota bacterium]